MNFNFYSFSFLPTGALTNKSYSFEIRSWELDEFSTINPYSDFHNLFSFFFKNDIIVKTLWNNNNKEYQGVLPYFWMPNKVRYISDCLNFVRQNYFNTNNSTFINFDLKSFIENLFYKNVIKNYYKFEDKFIGNSYSICVNYLNYDYNLLFSFKRFNNFFFQNDSSYVISKYNNNSVIFNNFFSVDVTGFNHYNYNTFVDWFYDFFGFKNGKNYNFYRRFFNSRYIVFLGFDFNNLDDFLKQVINYGNKFNKFVIISFFSLFEKNIQNNDDGISNEFFNFGFNLYELLNFFSGKHRFSYFLSNINDYFIFIDYYFFIFSFNFNFYKLFFKFCFSDDFNANRIKFLSFDKNYYQYLNVFGTSFQSKYSSFINSKFDYDIFEVEQGYGDDINFDVKNKIVYFDQNYNFTDSIFYFHCIDDFIHSSEIHENNMFNEHFNLDYNDTTNSNVYVVYFERNWDKDSFQNEIGKYFRVFEYDLYLNKIINAVFTNINADNNKFIDNTINIQTKALADVSFNPTDAEDDDMYAAYWESFFDFNNKTNIESLIKFIYGFDFLMQNFYKFYVSSFFYFSSSYTNFIGDNNCSFTLPMFNNNIIYNVDNRIINNEDEEDELSPVYTNYILEGSDRFYDLPLIFDNSTLHNIDNEIVTNSCGISIDKIGSVLVNFIYFQHRFCNCLFRFAYVYNYICKYIITINMEKDNNNKIAKSNIKFANSNFFGFSNNFVKIIRGVIIKDGSYNMTIDNQRQNYNSSDLSFFYYNFKNDNNNTIFKIGSFDFFECLFPFHFDIYPRVHLTNFISYSRNYVMEKEFIYSNFYRFFFEKKLIFMDFIKEEIIVFIFYIFGLVFPLLIGVAYLTLVERKILASIQRRLGPDQVGIIGLLQPIADALKLIFKEPVFPYTSDKGYFFIAPILSFIFSLSMWIVVPTNSSGSFVEIDFSLFYIFSISSLSVYSIVIAGWSSGSRYAFLGSIRSTAQMISYEISFGLIFVCLVVITGSLNLYEIVDFQYNSVWFIVPFFPLFVIFFISILAETNRSPFDLPEAEAELVSGYNVEFSSAGFALFFIAEYSNIIFMSSLTVDLFLGGCYGFDAFFTFIGLGSFFGNDSFVRYFFEAVFFSIKLFIVLIMFIWARAILPRYRYDQLMFLGWKIFLPITLVYYLICIAIVVW